MRRIKNFILSIGAVGTIVAPGAAVIGCGNNHNKEETRKLTERQQIYVDNLQALKNKFSGGVVKMTNDKALVIAERIKNVAALQTETGIDLTSLADTSQYWISAEGTSDGLIVITVLMITPADKGKVLKMLKLNIHQKSDAAIDAEEVKVNKDKLQASNLKAFEEKLVGGIITATTDKAINIAARINDPATLKTETGIDLTSLETSSSYAISASGNADGKLSITIAMTTAGATKPDSVPVTYIINHKSDIQLIFTNNLSKIMSVTTSMSNRTDLNIAVGAIKKGAIATNDLLGLTEPSELTDGVTITYVVKAPYNKTSGVIVVTATLNKDGESSKTKKDITISAKPHDFTTDLNKIKDLTSTKMRRLLKEVKGIKTLGASLDPTILGLEVSKLSLSSDVTTSFLVKTPYDLTTGKVVVTVILNKNGEKAEKNIIITAKTNDFAIDLAKIKNAFSSKNKMELGKVKGIKTRGSYLNPAFLDLGANLPNFSSSIMTSYLVKIPYDPATGKVTMTLTLKDNGEKATKDMIITASI